MRLLAEQTCSKVPTLILDPEGEYSTLREKVDVVLVSGEGDVRPSVKTAPLIARKLLELAPGCARELPASRSAFVIEREDAEARSGQLPSSAPFSRVSAEIGAKER